MIPIKGQYVKIIFRNSTQVEGFVEEWFENSATLKAEDGKSVLVILDIEQDVMAVKIVIDFIAPTKLSKKFEELVEEFQEVYEEPSADDLRTKRLAQLRIAMSEHERKMVAEKLKEHVPSSVPGASYGHPFTKPRSQ